MATQKTIDAVTDHFAATFAAEINSGEARIIVLRNNEDPTPPKKEADIDGKVTIYLKFPATKQEGRAVGAENVPWDETGAFLVHALTASNSSAAAVRAAEIAKLARDSLRNRTLADAVDIHAFLAGRPGESFGGNFWGESFAVEFQTQDV